MANVRRTTSLATLLFLTSQIGLLAANVDPQEVDIDIWHGVVPGSAVPDEKEVEPGAFTVANINDTDVDDESKKDVEQPSVEGEVDTMKVVIAKPSKKDGDKKLTLEGKGAVKMWTAKAKGVEVTLPHEYTYDELPVTLWAEATAPSKSVRDIELKVTYGIATDVVKATGIWATRTGFRSAETDKIFDDAGDPLRALWTAATGYASKLGKQLTPARGVCYAMNMEFAVSPPNIGNEPGIKFDVTRKFEKRSWHLDGGSFVRIVNTTILPGDLPNDEADAGHPDSNRDNDNTPEKDHIYSIDGPGLGSLTASKPQYVAQWNLYEFVRVNVENAQPAGNDDTESSRCSDFSPWHVRMYLVDDGTGNLKQNPGKPNEVGLGAVPLTDNP